MTDLPIMVATAFVLGVAARFIRLPPLVGFLIAGFALKGAGYESSQALQKIADIGVTLLLFSIGLKLQIKTLLKPVVWAGATIHMALFVALFGALFYALDFGMFRGTDFSNAALIAFALSFSSTVFAVKTFDGQGQSSSLAASTAIGILIMQDVIAVVFLAASKGVPPSPWALALLLLIPARVLFKRLMERSGHGELLILLAFLMAFGGYTVFEGVNLKGDLGALVMGMLVADHPKAQEMAKSMLGFKDIMLVGFFLTIGLLGIPSVADLGVALLLVALIPIKVALYFGVMTRFNLRARTSLLASLGLSTYSEFGLIVGALGVKMGWLTDQWLVIIAVSVAGTFIIASPLNAAANQLYDRYRAFLRRFEKSKRLPEEQPVSVGQAEVLIVGMGGLGTAAYDAIVEDFGARVCGIDNNRQTVARHVELGRNVVAGDPTDLDFWDRVSRDHTVKVAMLALPNHEANLAATEEIRKFEERSGETLLTATARFEDEIAELKEHGVDEAFNLNTEAGAGYAHLVRKLLR
ncbi:MAG: cation:proton antiporter [Deltaproteobacteria bacterium]|nr:cation:proton antiporter [Deltaproteobacteria bacterium]